MIVQSNTWLTKWEEKMTRKKQPKYQQAKTVAYIMTAAVYQSWLS